MSNQNMHLVFSPAIYYNEHETAEKSKIDKYQVLNALIVVNARLLIDAIQY